MKRTSVPDRWTLVFQPRRLLGLCYEVGVMLWLVWAILGSALMLTHKTDGSMRHQILTPEELTYESFRNYDDDPWSTAPDDRGDWYLSTDNDPHILWTGEAYVETVRLQVEQLLPPGSVTLYYLKPGQTDYRETQKVFARQDTDGSYVFDLGGITVTGLRIDPDSVGGVPTRLSGVELNRPTAWYWRFVPDGGQWILLLFGPAVAAGLLSVLRQLVRGE